MIEEQRQRSSPMPFSNSNNNTLTRGAGITRKMQAQSQRSKSSGTVVSLKRNAANDTNQPPTLFVHTVKQSELFRDNNLWEAADRGDLENLALFSTQPLVTQVDNYNNNSKNTNNNANVNSGETSHETLAVPATVNNGPPINFSANLGLRGNAERGSHGETILHVACLNGHLKCIKWIVHNFPALINEVYRKGRYRGETALHLAVVKSHIGDSETVEFLIQNGAKVNGPFVTGREFKNIYYENKLSPNYRRFRRFTLGDTIPQSGRFYYGQTVLHFAGAAAKDKILRYLVENEFDPADLTVADQYGNNVLHILAYHGYFKMFKYLRDRNQLDIKSGKTKIDLMLARNQDDLTPFQVGIARGHVEALDQIKEEVWQFGMETTYRVIIDEIDPLIEHETKSILRETPSSAIELAVINEDKNVVTHPLVDTLLKWKWSLYARRIFLARFALACLLTLSLTIAISLQPNSFQVRKSYDFSGTSICRAFFEIVALVASVITMSWEVRGFRLAYSSSKSFSHRLYPAIKEFGNQVYHYFTSKGSVGKVIQWTFSVLMMTILIIRFSLDQNFDTGLDVENILFGICIIFAYMHTMSYAQGFGSVGPLVVVFKRILAKDLVQWLWLYVAITAGFSGAFFLQMQSVPVTDWGTFTGSFVWTVRFLFSQSNYSDFALSRIPIFMEFIFILYMFIVTVLLFNMLIAKLVDTYEEVSQDSKRVWKVEFAALILDIDAHLSSFEKSENLQFLGVQDDSLPPSEAATSLFGKAISEIYSPQRYFLFTERRISQTDPSAFPEAVKLIVGRDKSGRRIEFVPFTHRSYWNGWLGDSIGSLRRGDDVWKNSVSAQDDGDEWVLEYDGVFNATFGAPKDEEGTGRVINY